VRVHVVDRRDADVLRLNDVDGVDPDARTDVGRRRGVVPRHVGRHDGGDDAAVLGPDAVALPPGCLTLPKPQPLRQCAESRHLTRLQGSLQ
jgi:hypothetical protein